MPALRLALNQIDTTFGDLPGNADLVVRWTRHAADQGAQLVAFPDATLIGSPAEAQQPRPWLLDASRSALVQLAERLESEGLGGTPSSWAASRGAATVRRAVRRYSTRGTSSPVRPRTARSWSGCTGWTWRSAWAGTSSRTASGSMP
ncbi:nitrilase-related carbon-nitrogen hydrolase [Streptacidiphilus monticola]